MVNNTFKLDLGQGDYLNTMFESEKDCSLTEFIEKVEKADKWFVLGDDTAIQKSHIKRVVKL